MLATFDLSKIIATNASSDYNTLNFFYDGMNVVATRRLSDWNVKIKVVIDDCFISDNYITDDETIAWESINSVISSHQDDVRQAKTKAIVSRLGL